jgi:hypothetical protein
MPHIIDYLAYMSMSGEFGGLKTVFSFQIFLIHKSRSSILLNKKISQIPNISIKHSLNEKF